MRTKKKKQKALRPQNNQGRSALKALRGTTQFSLAAHLTVSINTFGNNAPISGEPYCGKPVRVAAPGCSSLCSADRILSDNGSLNCTDARLLFPITAFEYGVIIHCSFPFVKSRIPEIFGYCKAVVFYSNGMGLLTLRGSKALL